MREESEAQMNIRGKVLVEVPKFRVFAQLYISRGKNAAGIDEILPKPTVKSTLVDQKARLKDIFRKNAVNPAPGVLCSLCGQVAKLSLRSWCSGHLTEIPGRSTTGRQAR